MWKRKKYGHKCCAAAKCNNWSDNWPNLSFHAFPKELKTRKEWELRMWRGDDYFKNVNHKFCCSEHFRPTDFKFGLTGQRRHLKKGSIPSIFEWTPEKVSLREERLKIRTDNISCAQTEEAKHSMDKMLQDHDSPMRLKESLLDCKTVKFSGPPTLGEFVENLQLRLSIWKKNFLRQRRKNIFSGLGLKGLAVALKM